MFFTWQIEESKRKKEENRDGDLGNSGTPWKRNRESCMVDTKDRLYV